MTKSGLSAFDIILLRYGTATAFLLPFIYKNYPKDKKFWQIIILSSVAAGIPYSLSGFIAFQSVPVAQSSILMNGTIGFFSLIVIKLWAREKNQWLKYLGVSLCLSGIIVMNLDKNLGQMLDYFGFAHVLLLWTAFLMAYYGIAVQKWQFSWNQLLVIAAPYQFIFAVILWLFFQDSSGLNQASWDNIILQALYQGLGPSILGVISYALAVKYFGRVPTAAMMAFVPALATLLAIPILDEYPHFWEIMGILIVAIGILLTIEWHKFRAHHA